MEAFSTGDGEAPIPSDASPSQLTTSASATHNLDSTLVDSLHDSSPVDAVTDVDVVATVSDDARPESSELEEDGEQLDKDEGTTFVQSFGAWSSPFTTHPLRPLRIQQLHD